MTLVVVHVRKHADELLGGWTTRQKQVLPSHTNPWASPGRPCTNLLTVVRWLTAAPQLGNAHGVTWEAPEDCEQSRANRKSQDVAAETVVD